MTDVDRAEVLAYAEEHGAQAAGERFGVAAGTIRSWRSRAGGSSAAAVKPGDDAYQVAELPVRFAGGEAPRTGAARILAAFSEGSDIAGVPEPIVRSWTARDEGGELPVGDDRNCFDRLRYAFASLPDDMRAEIALRAERAAWTYHQSDLQHLRIVAERERAAWDAQREQERRARVEATEKEIAEQGALAERERVAAEHAEANRARVAAERERAAAESEAMRRASEDLRRSAA